MSLSAAVADWRPPLSPFSRVPTRVTLERVVRGAISDIASVLKKTLCKQALNFDQWRGNSSLLCFNTNFQILSLPFSIDALDIPDDKFSLQPKVRTTIGIFIFSRRSFSLSISSCMFFYCISFQTFFPQLPFFVVLVYDSPLFLLCLAIISCCFISLPFPHKLLYHIPQLYILQVLKLKANHHDVAYQFEHLLSVNSAACSSKSATFLFLA